MADKTLSNLTQGAGDTGDFVYAVIGGNSRKKQIGTIPTFGDPSATIGLTATNGTATSAMRKDAAPALSQAIVPTWTGLHTFGSGTASSSTSTATIAKFLEGSSGSPVTAITPSVGVSRREATTADAQGGQNAALYVESVGTNVSNDAGGVNAQTNALTVYANQTSTGHGDVVAGFFNSTQDGVVGTAPSPHSAYGLFSQAAITRNGTNAYGLEVYASNSTGTNYTWTGTYPIAAAVHVGTAGAYRANAGIWMYTGSNPTFDIGLVFDVNSTNTYSIYDVSSAGTSIYLAGSRTNGINTTGGTYSGKAILGTGYSIDNAGAIVGSAVTANHASSAVVNATSGSHTGTMTATAAGAVRFGSTTNTNVSFIANNTFRGSIAASAADWQFGSSGSEGTLSLFGATSGSLKLRAAAVAGTSELRFPNGSTDFTATGGTGQFIKQASSGAAFTVSAPTISEIGGLGTGIATALAINTGSAGAPVLLDGALGTPSSGTVTNLTGTASININGTVGATTPTTAAVTTLSSTSTTDATSTSTGAITTAGGISSQKRGYFNSFTVGSVAGNSWGTATTFSGIGLYYGGTITVASAGQPWARLWQTDVTLTAAQNNDELTGLRLTMGIARGAFSGITASAIFIQPLSGTLDYSLYSTSGGAAILNNGAITSYSATAGVGYATGAGGTVTQATNKSTGVTLSKVCGAITMNNAALAAGTIVSFVLTNTAIAATDVLVLNHISGGTVGSYTLNAQCAAGSATINVRNNTAGSLSEAVVIQFAVIKGVNA